MNILGIETTCDETAAAVVNRSEDGRGRILSNIVLSQISEHAEFGGVVPEIAARAHVEALDSIVSAGCIVSGGTVRYSVLSPDVRVNSYTEVDSSIMFSHVNIGRHCRIRRAIIDRDVQLPEGTVICYDEESDRQKYFVSESGISVVTRDFSLFESPVAVDYFTSE